MIGACISDSGRTKSSYPTTRSGAGAGVLKGLKHTAYYCLPIAACSLLLRHLFLAFQYLAARVKKI